MSNLLVIVPQGHGGLGSLKQGQGDGELGTLTPRTLHRYPALMFLDDGIHNGKAKASASQCFLGGTKGLKYTFKLPLVNTLSCVPHLDNRLSLLIISPGRYENLITIESQPSPKGATQLTEI
jgi:hypothetical protein